VEDFLAASGPKARAVLVLASAGLNPSLTALRTPADKPDEEKTREDLLAELAALRKMHGIGRK
jgi:hypothetical protein